MHSIKHKRVFILLGDIVSFFGALFLVLGLRTGLTPDALTGHLIPFSILFALWLLVFFLFDLYEPDASNPAPRTIGKLLLAFLLNFFLGVLLFYAAPGFGIAPKSNLVLITIISCGAVIGLRRATHHFLSRGLCKTIAFYCSTTVPEELIAEVGRNEHFEPFDTCIESTDALRAPNSRPEILVVPERISDADLEFFATYPGEIARIDTAYEMFFAKVPLALMTEEKALACMERRYAPWSVFARTTEVIAAGFVLLVTLPVTLLAALAILIESGRPLFFIHERVGKNERPFRFYKFRSMKKDAEKHGPQWAAKRDERVTFVGKILRATHIDEIPQMLNIIKGDLALVGPRAERPEFVEQLKKEIPYYYVRHIVRPGFTGWAQIKYRYARTVDDSREKFEYDLFYIKNRSILLDLGIVIKTVQIIFTH